MLLCCLIQYGTKVKFNHITVIKLTSKNIHYLISMHPAKKKNSIRILASFFHSLLKQMLMLTRAKVVALMPVLSTGGTRINTS